MIQHFRFGLPLPTDSVVQEIPVSAGPVPFLTAEEDGWAYRMAPDAIVYGLGEMPRGINKRGWHYVTNNTDEARHSEDKLSYYGAHNFLLIDGGVGRECFGVFIDFPGKVRYDIGYTEYDALRFATEEPDYELYIITGDDLNEGDVIRATADLTQGVETSSSGDGMQVMENGDLYVGDPSNMPEGTVVMGGGDAPAGGPGGGPGGQ